MGRVPCRCCVMRSTAARWTAAGTDGRRGQRGSLSPHVRSRAMGASRACLYPMPECRACMPCEATRGHLPMVWFELFDLRAFALTRPLSIPPVSRLSPRSLSLLILHSRRHTMSAKGPDLKRYMDKRLSLALNKGRTVEGYLRGYDQFMNIVLDNALEVVSASEKNQIGMVVRVLAGGARAAAGVGEGGWGVRYVRCVGGRAFGRGSSGSR